MTLKQLQEIVARAKRNALAAMRQAMKKAARNQAGPDDVREVDLCPSGGIVKVARMDTEGEGARPAEVQLVTLCGGDLTFFLVDNDTHSGKTYGEDDLLEFISADDLLEILESVQLALS